MKSECLDARFFVPTVILRVVCVRAHMFGPERWFQVQSSGQTLATNSDNDMHIARETLAKKPCLMLILSSF